MLGANNEPAYLKYGVAYYEVEASGTRLEDDGSEVSSARRNSEGSFVVETTDQVSGIQTETTFSCAGDGSYVPVDEPSLPRVIRKSPRCYAELGC